MAIFSDKEKTTDSSTTKKTTKAKATKPAKTTTKRTKSKAVITEDATPAVEEAQPLDPTDLMRIFGKVDSTLTKADRLRLAHLTLTSGIDGLRRAGFGDLAKHVRHLL